MGFGIGQQLNLAEFDKVSVALTIVKLEKPVPGELYTAAVETLTRYLKDPFSVKDLK